jgi:hypothetical protein
LNAKIPVHLIGDRDNRIYRFLIAHSNFDDYFSSAKEFARHYRHWNTTNYEYELFCFQRWFILRDFLAHHHLGPCLYLDSDVLLYSSLDELLRLFSDCDMTLSSGGNSPVLSPHCSLWKHSRAIDGFCNFLMQMYSGQDPENLARQEAHYRSRQNSGLEGGACDMSAFYLFRQTASFKFCDNTAIRGGAFCDHNIRDPFPGFIMKDGFKRLEWEKGTPYARLTAGAQKARCLLLHCQGSAKGLMGRCYRQSGGGAAASFWIRSYKKIGRAWKRLRTK